MQGDFSRDSFEPRRGFTRVLSQQGRLTSDSDVNEAQAIQLNLVRMLAMDLIGPDGGHGFEVKDSSARNFGITEGRYYVAGIACENDAAVLYKTSVGVAATQPPQPYLTVDPQGPLDLADDNQYLVLLDVWERHVSFPETDGRNETDRRHPSLLREVALGGLDTASRAQVVWQVKVSPLTEKDRGVILTQRTLLLVMGDKFKLTATAIGAGAPALAWTSSNGVVATVAADGVVTSVALGAATITVSVGAGMTDSILVEVVAAGTTRATDKSPQQLRNELLAIVHWKERLGAWKPALQGKLRAQAHSAGAEDAKEPCTVAPTARYRGLENQLYRVEVHTSGKGGKATFKWSRENASVVFGVSSISGKVVKLSHWWRDARLGLSRGDFVEALDDDVTLRQEARRLCRVVDVDPDDRSVTLDETPDVKDDPSKHPILRRWDHKDKKATVGTYDPTDRALRIDESSTDWITLEDGVQIQFTPAQAGTTHTYYTGDYWLIPARTALADVVWHKQGTTSIAEPPKGIDHYYAPLAIIQVDGAGKVKSLFSLRRVLPMPT